MSEYDKVCIETFLRDQLKLFPEKVAETPEEAEDFLNILTRPELISPV